MEHFAFPGNIDFAADDQRIAMYYSWKADAFIHLWNNVYNRWITSNFTFKLHRTTSTASGWKSSIFNRNTSGERRPKFIASREDDNNKKPRARHREHRLAQRRQLRQHNDEKILQLRCKWSRWRERTPTADASKSDRDPSDPRPHCTESLYSISL